jgi:hypothetical protein
MAARSFQTICGAVTALTEGVMADSWKIHSLSLATTVGAFYIFCAIFDVLFPPFGLIAAVSAHSP